MYHILIIVIQKAFLFRMDEYLSLILQYQRSHARFASFALDVIRTCCYVHAFLSGLFFFYVL